MVSVIMVFPGSTLQGIGVEVVPTTLQVAPPKLVPVMVTTVAAVWGPELGEIELIVGAATGGGAAGYVNRCPLPAPAGDVTITWTAPEPLGATAVMELSDWKVKLALAEPNLTDVAPVRFLPLMTTVVPAPPLLGLRPVIEGAG
jgi:hypothetical protein